MSRSHFATFTGIGLALVLFTSLVWAEAPHGPKGGEAGYTLKHVMQHLDAAETELHRGLLMNNRLMIERGARAIADHPAPKGGLKPYIKKNHTKLMPTIASMDKQVHNTAKEIADQAQTAPILELHQLQTKMTNGCIGCHNLFRD
ncbi:MAG: hypothetical protein RIT81_32515 [Deltaproteobacteria bacterium]